MSWRRATAPPFGPDNTLSYSGGKSATSCNSSRKNSPSQQVSFVTNSPPFFSKYSPLQQQQQQDGNNNNNQVFRRKLEQAISVQNSTNSPPNTNNNSTNTTTQQHPLHQQYNPTNARESEGIVRSPRRTGGVDSNGVQQPSSTSGVSFMTGSGAVRNQYGAVVAQQQQHHQQQYSSSSTALNTLQQLPPYQYHFNQHSTNNHGITNNNNSSGSSSSLYRSQQAPCYTTNNQPYDASSSVVSDYRVQLAAVEGAMHSARAQRDQARRENVEKEMEILHSKREASDAANTALSSHRQHMMLDNALRTAEARIFQLERALEAEAQNCEMQVRKLRNLQSSLDGEFRQKMEEEEETLLALNDALDEKEKEIEDLKKQLAESKEQNEELQREIGNKQHENEKLEAQAEAISHQKAELSSFYERTVVDSQDTVKNLQRKHQEEILALQAEHSMQKIRLDEALTRATIGEDASRQALQAINNRLEVLTTSLDSNSTERERQGRQLADALCELKAASASALVSLTQDHQENLREVNLELAQDGELRTQIRRLQSALESATDERSQLQTKSEVLVRELDSARNELKDATAESARLRHNQQILDKNNTNPSSLVRQAVAKETAEEAIEGGIDKKNTLLDTTLTPARSNEKRNSNNIPNFSSPSSSASITLEQQQRQQRDLCDQQQQQQRASLYGGNITNNNNNNNHDEVCSPVTRMMNKMTSPRAGSVAARLNVLSVRGLVNHPELVNKKVKICTLVFGPLGQQLCDVECDEKAVVVGGSSSSASSGNENNNNNTFSNQSYHFKRDGRLPVSVYLHPADPSLVVVHIWAKIITQDEDDHYDKGLTESHNRSSTKGGSPISLPRKFLGCAVLNVSDILHRGPGTRVLRLKEREPHETDNFIKKHSSDKNYTSGLGFITIDVSGPFAACIDAPPLQNEALNSVLMMPSSSSSSQQQQQQMSTKQIKQLRHVGVPPPSVPALNLSPNRDDANNNDNYFTAEIWIRSISYLSTNNNKNSNLFFAELVSQSSKLPVLKTPGMQFDGDDGSSFWPKQDSTVTVTLTRNEGFLLQVFEAAAAASSASLSGRNNTTDYLSSSQTPASSYATTPRGNNNNCMNDNVTSLVGCADLDAAFILSECTKPGARKFGGEQSDRKAIGVHLEQRHNTGSTTAIVELVIRIVP